MDFSEKLLTFRANNKLTQAEVAKLFGVTANMIVRYESNKAAPRKTHKILFENLMNNYKK